MSQKVFSNFHVRLIVIGLVLAFCTNVSAKNPVGDVEVLFDTIQFFPEVDYQQLTLTVAGEDNRWQESFGPTEEVSLLISDFPDGQYRYELIAAPAADQAAQELARNDMELIQKLDRLERDSTFRQTGRFEVVSGEILLIDDVEDLQLMNMSARLPKGMDQ